MIKSELVALIGARNLHLYRRDVEAVVDAVLGGIIESLEQGNRVELRGFGVFSVTHRRARQGRNPRTGENVSVEEKWVPVFKAGREIGKRLNPKAE